ncbi:MAG: FHA domain-containing protein [Gemmatimonadota bacterium]
MRIVRPLDRFFQTGAALMAVLGFAAIAAVAVVPADVRGQEPTRVEAIRLDPDAHVNEIRTVQGVIDRLVSRGAGMLPSYYLEDDFGHQILVIPFEAPGARGARVTVTGVVNLDPSGDPVLTLFDAGEDDADVEVVPEVEPVTEDSVVEDAEASEAAPPVRRPFWQRWWPSNTVLFGIALILVAAAAYRFGRGPDDGMRPIVTGAKKDDVDFATDALWPESEQQFDGRTMRFIRPDPTMQLMPARLEVVGGEDKGAEIPFVGLPGEHIEMMIGRAPGPGKHNIELKQKTVSRTHAVIRHRHGEWLIENLSMTNPTVLNDEVLGVKERLLTDGDQIEMGEVVFLFKRS